MSAVQLGGRELADELRVGIVADVQRLANEGRTPRLAIVTATLDESSAWYVRSLERAAQRCVIDAGVVDLGVEAKRAEIADALERLSCDPSVDGIIVQTPLPAGIRLEDVAESITTAKDIDGANPHSIGRLAAQLPAHPPATAEAVLALADHYGIALAGRSVVVVGRSLVVGKPAALLMLARDATVTVCHSRTTDLSARCRAADVVVVATGRPGTVTAADVRPGAVVIDVGTNPDGVGGLVGDAHPNVADVAGALTPVPGGVGPVTSMLLMRHTVDNADRR